MALTGYSGDPGWAATTSMLPHDGKHSGRQDWEEEREHCGQVNHSHKVTRAPFLRTPPSWPKSSTSCLHQHYQVEKVSLCVSLDADRPRSHPGPLSDHSSREVVNVTVVLIPEAPGFLGKVEITVPYSGTPSPETPSPGTQRFFIPAKSQCVYRLQFSSHL